MKNNSLYITPAEIDSREHAKFYASEELVFNVTEDLLLMMEDNGVSKQQLATMMGKTKAYISQLLSGSRNMTLKTLSDICFALNLKPKIIISDAGVIARKEIDLSQFIESNWHTNTYFERAISDKNYDRKLISKQNIIEKNSKDLWSEVA